MCVFMSFYVNKMDGWVDGWMIDSRHLFYFIKLFSLLYLFFFHQTGAVGQKRWIVFKVETGFLSQPDIRL